MEHLSLKGRSKLVIPLLRQSWHESSLWSGRNITLSALTCALLTTLARLFIYLQVARIELRILGVRHLHCIPEYSSSSSRVRGRRCSRGVLERENVLTGATPSINVNISWNGDRAGNIEIPPLSHDEVQEFKTSQLHTRKTSSPIRAAPGNTDEYSSLAGRPVMLPMHRPLVMKIPQKIVSSKCDSGYGDEGAGDCGGRSHCLCISLTTNPGATCSENVCDPLAEVHTTKIQEMCFFERDLLRETWTELHVPFTTSNQSGMPNLGLTYADEGCRRKYRQWKRGRQANAIRDFAVVLQARANGMESMLSQPPLWLVRRDFAERTVDRTIRAAAAAVAQPRVEVTILGLRGEIESLLLPADTVQDEEQSRALVVSPRYAQGFSKTETGGVDEGSDVNSEGLLCETYWNGSLVHNVRLVRQAFVRPENARRTVPLQRESHITSPPVVRSWSRSSGLDHLTDGVVDEHPSVDVVNGRGSGENGIETEDLGCRDRLGRPSDENDPSTWFSTGILDSSSSSRDGETWINIGGTSSARISRDEWLTVVTGNEDEVEPAVDLDGDARTREGKPNRASLEWVPAEGETYRDQPFRFFLPACLSEKRTGKAVDESNGSIDHEGNKSTLEGAVRGNLRILLWATSSKGNTGVLSLICNSRELCARGRDPCIHHCRVT